MGTLPLCGAYQGFTAYFDNECETDTSNCSTLKHNYEISLRVVQYRFANGSTYECTNYGRTNTVALGPASIAPATLVTRTDRIKHPRNIGGISLVELLISVSIISVLGAIIGAAVVRTKLEAYTVDDLAKLHQLGIGAELYASDYDDAFPKSPFMLVEAGAVQASLVASKADTTVYGRGNQVRQDFEKLPPSTYKCSMLGWDDLSFSKQLQERLSGSKGEGWLVSFGTSDPKFTLFSGRYLRLTKDGSVLRRKHFWWPCGTPSDPRDCTSPDAWFTDDHSVILR